MQYLTENQTVAKGEVFPAIYSKTVPLMFKHERRRSIALRVHGGGMYLIPFHVYKQSILDDTQQNICTEGENIYEQKARPLPKAARKTARKANCPQ